MLASALVCAALTGTAARAEVYKWVDKDGVTHYSDRPGPGAEEVVIPPAQTYQAPPPQAIAPSPAPPPPRGGAAAKPGCEIRSPVSEEVLLNVQSVTIRFAGPEGATPVLMLNKKRYVAEAGANSIKIEPAARGAYEARLSFQNAQRETVCTAPVVTFYVRQPTVLRPARAR